MRLAELAREAGVERFLFSSSCIMYGMSEAAVVDEDSPLDPQDRVRALEGRAPSARIAELATDDFSPTFLRNGTVYGLSPRMRFDTVLNDLVGVGGHHGQGRGVQRRQALAAGGARRGRVARVPGRARGALEDAIHNQAFNIGATT